MLTSAGFKVISATKGTEALAMVAECKPDAVVLDINLPDVNGYEVCHRIRADSSIDPIPIIFHSAISLTGPARSHAESVGGTAFLTYPVDADHLIAVLRGALARTGRDT
jgi:CheY-like chemotaxis protein